MRGEIRRPLPFELEHKADKVREKMNVNKESGVLDILDSSRCQGADSDVLQLV